VPVPPSAGRPRVDGVGVLAVFDERPASTKETHALASEELLLLGVLLVVLRRATLPDAGIELRTCAGRHGARAYCPQRGKQNWPLVRRACGVTRIDRRSLGRYASLGERGTRAPARNDCRPVGDSRGASSSRDHRRDLGRERGGLRPSWWGAGTNLSGARPLRSSTRRALAGGVVVRHRGRDRARRNAGISTGRRRLAADKNARAAIGGRFA
jgi:hypothetical protein